MRPGCPLCKKDVQDRPTALLTSGIIYCEDCICPYIKNRKCCPITGIKTSIEQTKRLYNK